MRRILQGGVGVTSRGRASPRLAVIARLAFRPVIYEALPIFPDRLCNLCYDFSRRSLKPSSLPMPGVGTVRLAEAVADVVVGNQERPIVAQFDADKDGRLNAAERARAVEFIQANPVGRGGRGGGGGGGRGGNRPPASPGEKLTPADVENFPDAPLYDAKVLRTFFIDFENPNWEAELVAFNNTDVEVPATVKVDGKTYPDVGIHFRGNSSFGVGNGYKRSLNLTFDFVHKNQAILGYRTLNFLNSNGDPTFLRTVLSLHIARQYIPAPQANLVRVVINGENWGIYANAQQFNKEFLKDNFQTTQGTRWKVPQGGGGGIGAFRYVDENADSYKGVFQIKSKEQPAAWAALIKLARTLKDTPTEELEAALAPLLNIDGYLRFLALDNAMANGDGFYTRGADYSLYLHPDGRFHLIFYDVNEMFSSGGGGRGGGRGGEAVAGGRGGMVVERRWVRWPPKTTPASRSSRGSWPYRHCARNTSPTFVRSRRNRSIGKRSGPW